MKKCKTALTFLLAFTLLISSIFVTSATSLSFSDVKITDWYYNDIKTASAENIVNGYPDGTFRPQGSVSRAEFIKMLVESMKYEKMNGLYFSDTLFDKSNDLYWFHSPISTAINENILYRDEYKDVFYPDSPINRKEVAVFVTRALKLNLLPYASPYTDTDDLYISTIFNECIMQGSTDYAGNRYFYPNSTLSRSEACAVINRILDYKENKSTFQEDFFRKSKTTALAMNTSPISKDSFYYSMIYALQNGSDSIHFEYNGVPYSSNEMNEVQENLFSAFNSLSASRPELVSNLGMEFSKSGNSQKTDVNIKFVTAKDSDLNFNLILQNSIKARQKASEILPSVIEGLTSNVDKARAIHDYLVLNTEYSQNPKGTSFTAYGALNENNAVCQGYTAAFNLLCSLAGVKSQCVQNSTHAWNTVMISGTSLYYDATWDDPVPNQEGRVLNNYCGISESELLKTHHWDKSEFHPNYFD